MKDMTEYGNLFKSNLNNGLGLGGGIKNPSGIDVSKMNHEQYLAHRKQMGLKK